ncbi:hypothetical protein J6590_026730 [Homalodisca vitripennis]|nr:hypothetical protein J6590_026730 [Homalodisca vitripennis]
MPAPLDSASSSRCRVSPSIIYLLFTATSPARSGGLTLPKLDTTPTHPLYKNIIIATAPHFWRIRKLQVSSDRRFRRRPSSLYINIYKRNKDSFNVAHFITT